MIADLNEDSPSHSDDLARNGHEDSAYDCSGTAHEIPGSNSGGFGDVNEERASHQDEHQEDPGRLQNQRSRRAADASQCRAEQTSRSERAEDVFFGSEEHPLQR